jgi:hypothetical protein
MVMFERSESFSLPVKVDLGIDISMPKVPSPAEIRDAVCRCSSTQFLQKIANLGAVWRYPYYHELFHEKGCFSALSRSENRILSAIRSACSLPFRSFAKASFIEWRYYSIISKEFHGIFGAAIFNPENHLRHVAESGLLIIVAGVAGGAEAAVPVSKDFCWMKLFPMDSLNFVEGANVGVVGEHNSVSLQMRQVSDSHSFVELSGIGAPTVHLESEGLSGFGIPPQLGRDVSFFPGTHWIVNNSAPVARTSGTLSLSAGLGSMSGEQKFPNYISKGVDSHREYSLNGDGYYEHSFGMNPMPMHGWDFCFVPNVKDGNSLVMQTYRNSKELRYIDVHWTEEGSVKCLRFDASCLSYEWEKCFRHQDMKMEVPSERVIRGAVDGYTLEARNRILHQVPFLRPEKFFVRHFHISEEISLTSWTLKDSNGNVVCEVRDQPSGGETASLRTFV